MNVAYVNCDVGVDDSVNCGRVIDGWRAGVGARPYTELSATGLLVMNNPNVGVGSHTDPARVGVVLVSECRGGSRTAYPEMRGHNSPIVRTEMSMVSPHFRRQT